MLIVSLLVVVLPAFVVLGCAIVSRVRAGLLPRSLVVEYAPARGATIMGDAVLAEADLRAATAALLDLAVRRKVRLVAEEHGGKRTAVAVEVLDADFAPQELALLEALFGKDHPHGYVRRFSKDRRTVARRLRDLLEWSIVELKDAGVVTGTSSGRQALRLLAVLGIIVSGGLLLVAMFVGDWPVAGVLAFGVVAAIAALIITPRGLARRFAEAATPWRRHLDGLRQYMLLAEADRIRALQSPRGAELLAAPEGFAGSLGTSAGRFRLHERLLPYAVLFGIEREWVRELRLAYAELDDGALAELGDAIELTAELFVLADAIGSLAELGFAVGELVDGAGDAVEVVGGVFSALGDW